MRMAKRPHHIHLGHITLDYSITKVLATRAPVVVDELGGEDGEQLLEDAAQLVPWSVSLSLGSANDAI